MPEVDDFAAVVFFFCPEPDLAEGRFAEDFEDEAFLDEPPERAVELFAVDFPPPDEAFFAVDFPPPEEAFFAVDLPADALEPEALLPPCFAAPVDLDADDFPPPVDLAAADLAPPLDLAVEDLEPPLVFFVEDFAPPVAFLAVALLDDADLPELPELFDVDFFAVDFEAELAAVFFVVLDAFFGAALELDFDVELFEAAFFGAAFFGAVFFAVAMWWSSRVQKNSYDNEFSKIEISMRKKIYFDVRKIIADKNRDRRARDFRRRG